MPAYSSAAAAEYDRAFGGIWGQFIPGLLRAARVSPRHQVLDVASGTGVAAEAAVEATSSAGNGTTTYPASMCGGRCGG